MRVSQYRDEHKKPVSATRTARRGVATASELKKMRLTDKLLIAYKILATRELSRLTGLEYEEVEERVEKAAVSAMFQADAQIAEAIANREECELSPRHRQ